MNIVRALWDLSKRSNLVTSSVFQLTALRDKLNETLAEATQLALSPLKEDTVENVIMHMVIIHISENTSGPGGNGAQPVHNA